MTDMPQDSDDRLARELSRLRSTVRRTNKKLEALALTNELLRRELADRRDRERQRFVGVHRAAELLNVSPRTVRRWLRAGSLKGIKGNDADQANWLIDVVSIERRIASA